MRTVRAPALLRNSTLSYALGGIFAMGNSLLRKSSILWAKQAAPLLTDGYGNSRGAFEIAGPKRWVEEGPTGKIPPMGL